MKIKLQRFFILFVIALSFMSLINVADARRCRWVGAHWENGYWYPSQRICYGSRMHCEWVSYYRHGHYRYGGHKVCWYR